MLFSYSGPHDHARAFELIGNSCLNQASAMPPRVGGARGATGPNGCTDPWGHAANGPAPAPYGRELVSPQSLGPNGGPGRTVRPTGGRPSALHSIDHIPLQPMYLNMPVRKLNKRSFPKGVAESAAPGLGSIGPGGVLGPMASCQGSAGLANPCGEYGPEDHLPAHGARVQAKAGPKPSGPWGPGRRKILDPNAVSSPPARARVMDAQSESQ